MYRENLDPTLSLSLHAENATLTVFYHNNTYLPKYSNGYRNFYVRSSRIKSRDCVPYAIKIRAIFVET